jgi:hypothetical protein
LDSTFSPSPQLAILQLHPLLERALSSARDIKTLADLHRMGAYRFRMLDGVGPCVFREAAELLASHGLRSSADPRLDKEYAAILRPPAPGPGRQD